ncbi:hypothetical protein NUSPORA_00069 [Nucleospora cyclopteri]
MLKNLDQNIIEVLKNNKITKLTEIQEKTGSCAANGHDIIGIAPTGTGKTLAYILPMIQQIITSKKTYHCLILAPTRELAIQINKNINLFEELGIKTALLVGGEKIGPQIGQLNKYPHFVVGTPGRIAEHIEKNRNFKLKLIRKLILDEADRFFENDFDKEFSLIQQKMIKKSQTLMFTATMNEQIQKTADLIMRNPKIYKVERSEGVLHEYYTFIPDKTKKESFLTFIKEKSGKKMVIFCELCTTTEKLHEFLTENEIKTSFLNGKMHKNERKDALKAFLEGETLVLITTDVAGRGIDFFSIDWVVNYDLPKSNKEYLHRIGRTARNGNEGNAISFITQYTIEQFQKIEFQLGRKILNEYHIKQ